MSGVGSDKISIVAFVLEPVLVVISDSGTKAVIR